MHCRNLSPVVWKGLVAVLALAVQSAHGQIRVENGVVIRPDLKASKVDQFGKLLANPNAFKQCLTNDVCQTPLLMSPGGLNKDMSTWELDGCSVYWPYSQVRIGRGLTPILRWVLVQDPGDTTKYAFDPTWGIQLTGNNPKKDLNKGTADQDGKVFIWSNLHSQKSKVEIEFVPNVWRLDKNGKYEKKCNAADPLVVNEY